MKELNEMQVQDVNGGTNNLSDKIEEIFKKIIGVFDSEK